MRKIALYIVLISVSISLWNCEENVSPKADFEEEYVLNCIIRTNVSTQTAAVLKSFNVPGFDPESNISNPFITNANITLTFQNQSYLFKDTLIQPEVKQRYEGPLNYYYLDDFSPDVNYKEMSIKAVLPNGEKLSAKAITPISINFDLGNSNSAIPPLDNSSYVNIFWQPQSYNYFQYYRVRLLIQYDIIENGITISKEIEVPSQIREKNGRNEFVYPSLTRQISTSYNMTLVEATMEKLQKSVTNKKTIFINPNVVMEVSALDANVAAYYFASLSENIYTLRLDETIFSNIDGGYGIFGVIWENVYTLEMQSYYINRYGFSVKED